MEDYGILSLIPPLVAIILCFWTKQVLLSLFMGILAGGMIIKGGNPFTGLEYTLDAMVKSMTDEWNARLLLFNLLMGSGIAFIWKLGGSQALTDWAIKKIKSRKTTGIGAWLLGIFIFFNDYVNAAIVGNVFRDVAKAHRVSSEKLSYILDSTAAPVATFFISDWVAFQIGMIQSGIDAAKIENVSAFQGYMQSIPLNLYCIFSVVFVGILVFTGKDFGSMRRAEERALATGKLVRDGGQPMMDVGYELGEPLEVKPQMSNLLLPMLALVGVTLFGFLWTGREGDGLVDILSKCDAAKALLWGAIAMTLTGIGLALGRRMMNIREAMDTVLDGLKLMLLAGCILVLAWSLGSVTKDMKLADFIITVISGNIPFAVVPVIIFFFGMIISFATGTSWGTMTILTPIAIPLTYQMTGDVHTSVAMAGVVFSGSIFGDHCSPISDTTVLSSIFAGADHIDHVSTQIPYAIAVAGVAGLMFFIYGLVQLSPVLLIGIGCALLFVLLYLLAGISAKRAA